MKRKYQVRHFRGYSIFWLCLCNITEKTNMAEFFTFNSSFFSFPSPFKDFDKRKIYLLCPWISFKIFYLLPNLWFHDHIMFFCKCFKSAESLFVKNSLRYYTRKILKYFDPKLLFAIEYIPFQKINYMTK